MRWPNFSLGPQNENNFFLMRIAIQIFTCFTQMWGKCEPSVPRTNSERKCSCATVKNLCLALLSRIDFKKYGDDALLTRMDVFRVIFLMQLPDLRRAPQLCLSNAQIIVLWWALGRLGGGKCIHYGSYGRKIIKNVGRMRRFLYSKERKKNCCNNFCRFAKIFAKGSLELGRILTK